MCGITGAMKIINNVLDIPNGDIFNASEDYLLPALPVAFTCVTRTPSKTVLLKQNVAHKNCSRHPEIKTERDSMAILDAALYHGEVAMLCKPRNKPNYWTSISIKRGYCLVVLDTDKSKEYIEVVGWRKVNKARFDAMKRKVGEEGGQFLITGGADTGWAADLSALHPD